MLLCPGGCALRAPRSARSRYKVDVAVRRRWASPSFIQFVYSDRFKVSQIPSFCIRAESRAIARHNKFIIIIHEISCIFFSTRIPPRGEETGVSNKLQALSSARLESW
jgi:hypothetical protein